MFPSFATILDDWSMKHNQKRNLAVLMESEGKTHMTEEKNGALFRLRKCSTKDNFTIRRLVFEEMCVGYRETIAGSGIVRTGNTTIGTGLDGYYSTGIVLDGK